MAISNIKNSEPLYVVIFRDPKATELFKSWISSNRAHHAQVVDNKLQLYDYHSLNLFMVTWTRWDQVVIWDSWNRRHIYS